MQDKIYKVGIAGYGVVGPRRRKFIDAHPQMQTVAICDQKYTDKNLHEKDVTCLTSYQELLEEDLDIIFICLPPNVAPDATIESLKKGLHVFCEKPPGRSVEDIQRVIQVEKECPNLKLKYGFNHRYHDSVREAMKVIESGDFGKILNMRGVYGKSAFIPWPRPTSEKEREKDPRFWRTSHEVCGGGILLDQGIHMIDLMRLFAGTDFTDVKSFVSNEYWKHNVEDNAYALMKTDTGVVAMLHSTATQWRHRFSLEIYLEKGAVLLSGILSGTKSYGQETLTLVFKQNEDNGNPKEQTTNFIQDNSWRDEILEFADAVLNNKPIESGTSEDALKSMELVFKIYNADDNWAQNFMRD